MGPELLYYLWATLLVLASLAAWSVNLFAIPGNWIMLGLAAVFVALVPPTVGGGISWGMLLALAVLAGLGELIEFAAGAAGAANAGGSRRAMLLAIVGTMAGSITGAILGLPIPLIGPVVAALGGACLGAFAGAWLGETWKGRSHSERMAISRAALVGRLLGTLGKLFAGGVMLSLLTLDAFLRLY